MNEVLETMHDVLLDVETIASSLDMMMDEAFTQYMANILTESHVVDDYHLAHFYNKRIGARIDAYEFEEGSVTLFSTLWKSTSKNQPVPTVTKTELADAAKRSLKFFKESIAGKLPGDRIDVGNSAYDVARFIYENRDEFDTLKVIILTNGVAPRQVGKNAKTDGVNVLWEIWDANRINDFMHNKERRGASINFNEYDGPIDCVKFTTSNQAYTTYLAFVQGKVLADMYERHKTKLLERNVRVFLSQRVKVNKGIRDTIRDEPNLFCAYNNGITVVAESVNIFEDSTTCVIQAVDDFQIVNGGQTTASLYHTRKKFNSDLSKIFVQMKLMVIHDNADRKAGSERLADVLIPKIGRFSNTQNKVSMSDLSANDKPHPDLHRISTSTPARDPSGGTMNTYWFYENSRGKWDELRRHENTQAKRRIYDSKFPKQQRFDKGMFAKVWYSHLGKPDVVSKGPQKCFAFFQQDYLSNLGDDEDLDAFFKKTIALLLMWKHIEGESKKKVRQGIYQSFTQNITAYALAMFSFKNPTFDLYDYLWEKQDVGKDLAEYLEILTDRAHDHITDLPSGLNLVPEFAKKEECWKNFKAASYRIPELSNLANIKMRNEYSTYSKGSTGGLNQVHNEDVIYCMELPGTLWTNLAHRIDFFRGTLRESSKEVSQCNSMAELINTKKIPSDSLAKACRTIHERALEDGWKL
jgi:hypothetical protein